jgi:hypothetical protein
VQTTAFFGVKKRFPGDAVDGKNPFTVGKFYGEQVNRQGVVPEREDNQQLSDRHPAEDEDEEQSGNNPLRHPEQTGGLIRTLRRPFLP